jgi:hypothetical protein
MEYNDMVQAHMDNWEREIDSTRRLAEARRVGAFRPTGPREWLDGFLIRASKGAEQRQARRNPCHGRRETAA